jgi:hypothetical protein
MSPPAEGSELKGFVLVLVGAKEEVRLPEAVNQFEGRGGKNAQTIC